MYDEMNILLNSSIMRDISTATRSIVEDYHLPNCRVTTAVLYERCCVAEHELIPEHLF